MKNVQKKRHMKRGGMDFDFENEDNGPMHIDELNVSPLSTTTDVETPQRLETPELIEEISADFDNTIPPTNLMSQFNEVGDDNNGDDDDDDATTIASESTTTSQLGGKTKNKRKKASKKVIKKVIKKASKNKTKKASKKASKKVIKKTSKNKTKKASKNKTKKASKKASKKKSKKMKGGRQLYGTGYGANCHDPNYSIYNTNELKLFPYKPM